MTRANIRGPRLSYRRGKTGQEVDLPILPELAKELAHLPRDQMMLLAHGTQGKGYTAGSLSNVFRDMCAEAGLNHCSAHGLRKACARRLAEHGATEWEVMAFLAHRTAKEASRYTAAANRAKLTTSGMAKLGADHEKISCLSMKVRSPMPCSCSCLSPTRSQRRRRELHGADSDMAQRLESAMAHTLRLGSLAELHGKQEKYCPTFPKGWTKGGPKLMKYNGKLNRVVTPTGIEPVSPP